MRLFNRSLNRHEFFFIAIVSFLMLLLIWVLVTSFRWLPSYFMPSPIDLLVAGKDLFSSNIQAHWLDSVIRVVIGVALGLFFTIPLALIVGVNLKMEAAFEFIFAAAKYIPIPVFVPLSFFWIGIGVQQKLFLVSLGVFLQIFPLLTSSVRHLESNFLDIGRSYGLSDCELMRSIILPRIYPAIFDATRVSFVLAWAYLMFAEMTAGDSGLGFALAQAQRYSQTSRVYMIVILIAVTGLLIDTCFKLLRPRLFYWEEILHGLKQGD